MAYCPYRSVQPVQQRMYVVFGPEGVSHEEATSSSTVQTELSNGNHQKQGLLRRIVRALYKRRKYDYWNDPDRRIWG